MPTFTYTARDAKGQIKNATIEAASRDDVVAQLRRQRMNVVKINEETKKQKVGKISMRDIVIFTRRDHVHVQLVERLRVLAERVGDCIAGLDVEHDRLGHDLEALVLRLLREDVERLHQRQTGVDHRGELAGEDDDVAHRDLPDLLLLRLLVVLDDVHPLTAELGDHVVPRRGFDRRVLDLTLRVARRICECGHLESSGLI